MQSLKGFATAGIRYDNIEKEIYVITVELIFLLVGGKKNTVVCSGAIFVSECTE
jgi:hypothetical protein